ncbi:MAG: acyl-CoA dehydrogenase family protein, partial [Reyranellales bacterium]
MKASGLSPDQLKLQARVRELAAGPVASRAAEIDRTEQYPWDNVELLKDEKLLGITIPTQYGGQSKSWLDAVLVIEALSATCSVTGRIAVETNMGAISAVMAYGSEEQKKMAAGDRASRRQRLDHQNRVEPALALAAILGRDR